MKRDSLAINQPWTLRVLEQGEKSREAMRLRLDSWANALTGLNTSRDKTTQTLPYIETILSPQLLEVMYHTSDIAARVVSAVPDEAFKRPYKVVSKSAIKRARVNPYVAVGDNAGPLPDPRAQDERRAKAIKAIDDASTGDEQERAAQLESCLNLNGSRTKQHEAMTWGRLYGLGAVLIGADDGQPLWAPLDWKKVKSVDYATVLDKRDLTPWRWYAQVAAPKFGDIALYMVQPVGVFVGAPYDLGDVNTMLLVHESRLLRFGGELTSKRERLRNQGADYSVLQKCFRALQLIDNNWQSASALLADASQAVIKIKGLIDMISQEPDTMTTRMQLVDQMRSVMRAMVLDADGEEFERKPTPFSGIPELLRETWARGAAAARMPLVIFMGTSTKGLGDTGDSEIRWWYDIIASVQEQKIKPVAEYELRLHAVAYGFDNPEDWTVVFPPLWQMSEKEIAALHLAQAQADDVYIKNGVCLPEEIAISRFGQGEYSLDTVIDVESRRRTMAISLQAAETQAQNDLDTAENPPEIGNTPGVADAGGKPAKGQATNTPDPKPPGNVEN